MGIFFIYYDLRFQLNFDLLLFYGTIVNFLMEFFLLITQIKLKFQDRIKNIRIFLEVNFFLLLILELYKWLSILILNIDTHKKKIYLDSIVIFMFIGNFIFKWWREQKKIPNIPLKKPNRKDFGKRDMELGTIYANKKIFESFFFNINDLKRHTLIYGQTGTGKTTFVKRLLFQFKRKHPHIPLLLFEFKGEYLDLKTHLPDIKIVQPGINYSFNLFDHDFFEPSIYVEILFDSLKSCRIIEESSEFSQIGRAHV